MERKNSSLSIWRLVTLHITCGGVTLHIRCGEASHLERNNSTLGHLVWRGVTLHILGGEDSHFSLGE
jgi:hypothetical protein